MSILNFVYLSLPSRRTMARNLILPPCAFISLLTELPSVSPAPIPRNRTAKQNGSFVLLTIVYAHCLFTVQLRRLSGRKLCPRRRSCSTAVPVHQPARRRHTSCCSALRRITAVSASSAPCATPTPRLRRLTSCARGPRPASSSGTPPTIMATDAMTSPRSASSRLAT
jgi:hypothetical protein